MAIRTIRLEDDELLRKISKKVTVITPSVIMLMDDMIDTMRKKEGLGLAAPQVGALRRIIMVDIGEGLVEMINPEIVEATGNQNRTEGCLSIPGETGKVNRPAYVKVRAFDRELKEFFVEGEELMAVALCHEIDHLDGILYKDKAISMDEPVEDEDEDDDDEYEDDDEYIS